MIELETKQTSSTRDAADAVRADLPAILRYALRSDNYLAHEQSARFSAACQRYPPHISRKSSTIPMSANV
jgi:hypothetical protein